MNRAADKRLTIDGDVVTEMTPGAQPRDRFAGDLRAEMKLGDLLDEVVTVETDTMQPIAEAVRVTGLR